MSAKKDLISFCLIILLAGVLRFSGNCFDSLWLDEGYQSLIGASGHGAAQFAPGKEEKLLFRFDKPAGTSEMLANFRKVDPLCPPLYALFLNRWICAFGDSDFVLRSLSAIISTASVLSLMLFARYLIGPKAALLAGLLQAASPFDIHYAQEARMYCLVVLCSVISGGSLLTILKSELKCRFQLWLLPLYAVSTAAMVNSHYTALFLAASEGFAVLAYLVFQRKWRMLAFLGISWTATALLCLPWLPMFLQSASSRKESFYVARQADLIWPFKALLRIPTNWLVFLSGQRVIAYAAGLYFSSTIFLLVSILGLCRSASGRFWPQGQSGKVWHRRHLQFVIGGLWIWALMPALGIWLVDLLENHKVIEVSRYLIFTSPAIYMLAGSGLMLLGQQKKILAGLLAAHLLFAGVNLIYTHSVQQREPWQEMARQVEELIPVDSTLIVSQFYDIACLDRYLSKPRLQTGMSPSMGREALDKVLENKSSFALLTAQEGESIKDFVPGRYKLTKQVDLSHGLHLRLYELAGAPH